MRGSKKRQIVCGNMQFFVLQQSGVANYIEREMKRRGFVVARWDFREHEKRELEAEAKRKAGVSYRG